jgi:hypothetical protein
VRHQFEIPAKDKVEILLHCAAAVNTRDRRHLPQVVLQQLSLRSPAGHESVLLC